MAEAKAFFCGSMERVKFAVVAFPLISELPATKEYLAPAIFERFKNPDGMTAGDEAGFLNHSIVPLSSGLPAAGTLGMTISPVNMPLPLQ
jgi:hypothetical protein